MEIVCLQIHNDYQIPGGETKTAIGIADLLEDFGVTVIRYYKSNNSLKEQKTLEKIFTGIKAINNLDTVKEVQEIIEQNKVNFALIHNVLPIISNSIYTVLEKNKIPIIKYIQNYNLLCLNGAIDHKLECKYCKKNNFQGVKLGCYKKSRLYSLIRFLIKKNFEKNHYSHIAAFMPNSIFVMDRHLEYGLDEKKMYVMYNYIEKRGYHNNNQFNGYYLYFGRIAQEKGVFTVLNAAKKMSNLKFCFMGDGELNNELRDRIEKENISNVEFVGSKNGEELFKVIENAKATIIPSEWDEPLPRTILESYSVGTPVIGSKRGGIIEMINIKTGYLYESGDVNDLIKCINKMENIDKLNYELMRNNALREIEQKYSKEKYFERFMRCINKITSMEA